MSDEIGEQLIGRPAELGEDEESLEGFGFGARIGAFVGLSNEEREDFIGEVGEADQSANDRVELLQICVGEQSVDRGMAMRFGVGQHALDGQNGVFEAENIGEMHSIYGVQRMQQRLGGEAAERLDRSVAKEGLFALEIDRRVVHEAVICDVGEEIASLLLEGEERLQGLQRMHGLRGFLGLFGVGGLDGVEEFHRFAR